MTRPGQDHESKAVSVTQQPPTLTTESGLASDPTMVGHTIPDPPAIDRDESPARRKTSRRKPAQEFTTTRSLLLSLLAAPVAMARDCVPLTGSRSCSAFQSASISGDSFMIGLLCVELFPLLTPCLGAGGCRLPGVMRLTFRHSPFLKDVTSTETFDQQLEAYVQTSYVQEKWVFSPIPSPSGSANFSLDIKGSSAAEASA